MGDVSSNEQYGSKLPWKIERLPFSTPDTVKTFDKNSVYPMARWLLKLNGVISDAVVEPCFCKKAALPHASE